MTYTVNASFYVSGPEEGGVGHSRPQRLQAGGPLDDGGREPHGLQRVPQQSSQQGLKFKVLFIASGGGEVIKFTVMVS